MLHIHISYLSVTMIRHHDQKQHKEERVDFGLRFQKTGVPNAWEDMTACSRSGELAGHIFSPSTASREVSQKVRQFSKLAASDILLPENLDLLKVPKLLRTIHMPLGDAFHSNHHTLRISK